jgi:hypothetical protein
MMMMMSMGGAWRTTKRRWQRFFLKGFCFPFGNHTAEEIKLQIVFLFLDAKEAHDNIVRCAYDHVGGENRRRILPMQRETRCDWVRDHSGTFCAFFVCGTIVAVVYEIYPKDSSCKRDEQCDKSVRKRYTETEKWWKHFAVCLPFDSLLEKSVSKSEKIGVLGRTLRFAL